MTKTYTKSAFHNELFNTEISEALKTKIISKNHSGTTLTIYINPDTPLTAQEETDLQGFVDAHDASLYSPVRILSLAKEEARGKHFHNINYKTELTVPLQKVVTFGEPGLLTKAELFADEAKTIRVLDVEREYDIDAISGKLLRKKTVRKYYKEDGTLHPLSKDLGWYVYTGEESRDATHRRRRNITNRLEDDMLSMLVAAAGGNSATEAANVQGGTAFMRMLTPAISVFHASGDIADIVAYVSDTTAQSTFTFLTDEVAPGVPAYQFIIAGVTY